MKASILDDQQEKGLDVDRSSSANSFSIIPSDEEPDSSTSFDCPVNQFNKKDLPVVLKEKVKLEASSDHLMAKNQDTIAQIATVNYRGLIIRIFMEITNENKNLHRFFFEPMVLLDLDSITSESHVIFKQEFVRFTIQMWTTELRSRVLDRLRTLPSLWHLMDIQEDDISVMPYENVQLVSSNKADGSINHESIRLMDQASSYQRMNENLDFYFICDSATMANALAQDFKKNAEFTLKSWQLSLVCRGIHPMILNTYTINVFSNQQSKYILLN